MQHSTPTTFVYIEHILKIKYILILSNFEIQMAWHVSGVWILSFTINFVHLIIFQKCFLYLGNWQEWKTMLILNSQFFWNWRNCNPNQIAKPNYFGFWLVPNGHTLAGFAIGALSLAIMATLHLYRYIFWKFKNPCSGLL